MSEPLPTNGLRKTVDSGGVALGVLDNTYNPTLVEFYGDLGVDFVWLDFEHGGQDPWDAATVENLLRAADGTGTELLVRLPDTSPTLVRKALDLGVKNVFLPRVESAGEVREAVKSGRFRYDGEAGDRGLAAPQARRWGFGENYIEVSDEETLVGTTIETEAAVENIDDILAVPDLGFVFIGPFDLSVSLGHPGEIDHPEVQDAVETVRSAAVEADVTVGGLGFGMDDVNEKAESGLHVGSTTGAVQNAVRGWLEDFDVNRS